MPSDKQPPDTKLIRRCVAILRALRDSPLDRPALLQSVWAQQAYPFTRHAARMLERDIDYLQLLGITIERSRKRLPIYTLHGGLPLFTSTELRTLALLRDTFDPSHPQAAHVHALVSRLTTDLTEQEQHVYHQQQALQIPVQPAIDYAPYAKLTTRLEEAITTRRLVRFAYCPTGSPAPTLHCRVEPFGIEYYERHFYFVGYSHNSGQIHDFRIDRIQNDDHFALLERLPPDMAHERCFITFRYRLAAVLARGEISQRFANQRIVERLPNGDVIIEAEGRSGFFIRRTLLKYAGNAELLEPAWLRAEMAADVAALGATYSSASDRIPPTSPAAEAAGYHSKPAQAGCCTCVSRRDLIAGDYKIPLVNSDFGPRISRRRTLCAVALDCGSHAVLFPDIVNMFPDIVNVNVTAQ